MAGITDKQCDEWATQLKVMSVQDMRLRLAGLQVQKKPVRWNQALPDLGDISQAQDFRDAYVAICTLIDSMMVVARDPKGVTDRAPYKSKMALLNYLAATELTMDVGVSGCRVNATHSQTLWRRTRRRALCTCSSWPIP